MATPRNAAASAEKILADDLKKLAQTEGDNHAADVEFKLETASQLGVQAAKGASSLTELAIAFTGWVADKAFTRDNADKVYGAYAEAFNANLTHGTAPLKTGDDARVSISIFKSFGNARIVAHGKAFHDRVLMLRADVPADRRMSGYNSMVAVNRGVEKLENLAAHVTDAQIIAFMTQPVKADKDELQKLAELIVRMEKLKIDGIEGECQKLTQFHAKLAGQIKANPVPAEGKAMTAAEIKAELEVA